jgi:hypothetical protein
MEAHAGTIRIPARTELKPRWRLFHLLRGRARAARRASAGRAQAAQANRGLPSSIPGSEHSHLILPPKAY